MKKQIFIAVMSLLGCWTTVGAQIYETQYTRSISDVMADVQRQFGVKFKYNVDTAGIKLTYADFRRSEEHTSELQSRE